MMIKKNLFFQALIAVSCCLVITEGFGEVPRPYFAEPEVLHRPPPSYPRRQENQGKAGGGSYVYSITRDGKTANISMLSITNPAFEKPSLKAIRRYEYPASSEGTSEIIGRVSLAVNFEMESYERRPQERFLRFYKRAQKMLADEPVEQSKLLSLVESLNSVSGITHQYQAYGHVMKFEYFKRFGTLLEQMNSLEAALIFVTPSEYRSDETNSLGEACMRNLMSIQLRLNRLGDALYTYEKFKRLSKEADPDLDESFEQIYSLIDSDQSIETRMKVSERGKAFTYLLKKKLSVELVSGALEKIKLRCDRAFIEKDIESLTELTIPLDAGSCHVEFIGAPASEFVVRQI